MAGRDDDAQRPPSGRGSFARRWLWRPGNLALGLLLLFMWADRLDGWRPARPLPDWQRWVEMALLFLTAGVAWQNFWSALFTGWRAGAEPGVAADAGRMTASRDA